MTRPGLWPGARLFDEEAFLSTTTILVTEKNGPTGGKTLGIRPESLCEHRGRPVTREPALHRHREPRLGAHISALHPGDDATLIAELKVSYHPPRAADRSP